MTTLAAATAPPQSASRGLLGRVSLLSLLSVALVTAVLFAAGRGQLDVPPAEVLGSVLHKLGLDIGPLPSHPQGENTLWQVRFPRVLTAVIAGASLATAGALMQGVFGNPLAEPGVVGVSSGAAVGAASVIVFGLTFAGTWTAPVAAFVTGLVTTLLVYMPVSYTHLTLPTIYSV